MDSDNSDLLLYPLGMDRRQTQTTQTYSRLKAAFPKDSGLGENNRGKGSKAQASLPF